MKPLCYDCLSEDVTVKVIDGMGFEHWFCAEDWAGWQEFGEKMRQMLRDATEALEREAGFRTEDVWLTPR